MSISKKMILYFSVLFIVIITMIGTVSYQVFSSSIREQVVQDTEKIMDQTTKNVDSYFSDMKTPMIMLARNPHIAYAFKFYNQLDWADRLDLSRSISDITNHITEFKFYINDIILVGLNGYTYSTSNANQLLYQYDFTKADWFQEATRTERPGFNYVAPHVSDYYAASLQDPGMNKVVTALLAVKENHVLLGYVLCDIKVNQLNAVFGNLSLGKGGSVYMIDNNGKILFHPDETKVGTMTNRQIVSHAQSKNKDTFTIRENNEDNLILLARSDVTDWILVAEIPNDTITKSANQVRKFTYWILAAGIVLVVIISFLISLRITKPLKLIMDRIKDIQIQRFETKHNDYGKGEMALLGGKLENMIAEIDRLIKDVYISELKKKEAVLKMLQSQIQPHFLYNTLQLIKAEAFLGNKKDVSSIINSFSDLLRYTLYNHDEAATIENEIQYTANFLEITKKRFGDKFNYFFDVDVSLLNVKLPKLMIQPIVENCMIHGLEHTKTGGIIRIRVQRDNHLVLINVYDNGAGIPPLIVKQLNEKIQSLRQGESIGLVNVNERIRLKFGDSYGLHITSELGEYTNVQVSFPYEKPIHNEQGELL